jgi:hypothetical protein
MIQKYGPGKRYEIAEIVKAFDITGAHGNIALNFGWPEFTGVRWHERGGT